MIIIRFFYSTLCGLGPPRALVLYEAPEKKQRKRTRENRTRQLSRERVGGEGSRKKGSFQGDFEK